MSSTLPPRIRRARLLELAFGLFGLLLPGAAAFTLLVLMFDLVRSGLPHLDWDFLSAFPSRRPERAGILPAWVGSLAILSVTAALAVPLGVAAGLYLEAYAPRGAFTRLVEVNIANLAGVPSILYGLLGLALFVDGLGLGASILSAAMVLALLILPVVIVATREALRAVPRTLWEAAYALGADRRQTLLRFVLPAAAPGILTGVIVALSRAVGETAPLVAVGALSFIAFLPPSPLRPEPPYVDAEWLFSPFTALSIQMFGWLSRPQPAFHELAAAAGVVLLALALLINALAIVLRLRARRLAP